MSDYIFKTCPKCGQQLRFPKRIGGMLMACPSCKTKFASDFKIGSTGKTETRGVLPTIFELPSTLLERILQFFFSK